MNLDTLGERSCRYCRARMFFFRNPPRYLCLRENKHGWQYLTGNIPGRNGHEVSNENDLHLVTAEMPVLRDAADFCGADLDMPESAYP